MLFKSVLPFVDIKCIFFNLLDPHFLKVNYQPIVGRVVRVFLNLYFYVLSY